MATCANCGTQNPDQSKFCGNCGQALEAPAAQTESLETADATTPQEAATQQHAAYEAAMAAINAPSTDVPPAAQSPQAPPVAPPVTPTAPVTPQPGETAPPAHVAPPGQTFTSAPPPGGSNKKVIMGIVIGSLAGLAILAAIWFFFLRDSDPEPVATTGTATEAEGEDVTTEGDVPAGEAPAFDAIEPLIAQTAGPYSVTQTSSEACEPPCIFPSTAHAGSTETMQVTYDAGTPESQIYGEFLLYGTVEDAQAGLAATAADLEANGYTANGSFTIQGVTGTTYQSTEDEILLWSSSNLMMGLAGNKGYPTELVGYLD